MKGKISFLYSISQLHCGKGSDSGVVDLPIQREVHTELPIITGIKGAIRNEFNFDNEIKIFGSKPKNNDDERAGSIAFSEAKIFLYPVRSLTEGFVWVTCPLVLSRLKTVFKLTENKDFEQNIGKVLEKIEEGKEYSAIKSGKINIEEYEADTLELPEFKGFLEALKEIYPESYLKDKSIKNTYIISDKDFKFFVKNSTEIMARITIDSSKGVTKDGSLRYEEFLPQDTVMYFLTKEIIKDSGFDELENVINEKFFNIGGKTTIGKGFVYLKMI
ncbi:MAG TPA: type III-B CRISPR module RAMP protein Cmr4 [Tepiditoga sp.]|nr:type III-B CRISPR module RAMP protein Cmr4 [Thermotogota bacterium]HOO75057.1 type III-B CRISPR module RAMP protein Cmr4 [Tepiditoga sp.]